MEKVAIVIGTKGKHVVMEVGDRKVTLTQDAARHTAAMLLEAADMVEKVEIAERSGK